jgi:hypothetical protein
MSKDPKTTTTKPAPAAGPTIFDQVPEPDARATSALAPVPDWVEDEDRAEREVIIRMTSLMQRAGSDPARIKQELDNRELILTRLREATIKKSKPTDWTLYKSPEGQVIGVPRDSLLVIAKKIYGIDITRYRPVGPDGPEARIEDTDDVVLEREGSEMKPKMHNGSPIKVKTATMWADGLCTLTGERLPDQMFTARTGRFAGQETYTSDLRQSCRTSLDALIVRKLSGLRKVPGEELQAAGVDLEKCYKGSGFGTAKARGAAAVQEEGAADAIKLLVAEVTRRTGGDKDAMRSLSIEITKDDTKGFKGWDDLSRLTAAWQAEKAMKKLLAHPVFGDSPKKA